MTGSARILTTYLLLVALLAASVTVGGGWPNHAATLLVLLLATAKIAIVASEYVEVRGSAPWLIAVWSAWGVLTPSVLAVLLA